jgi:hypothetical protein
LFRNQEIWGVDKGELSGQYVPSGAVEELFRETLKNYLEFAKHKLQLALPLRLIVGLSNVEHFQITVSSRDVAGRCVEKEIVYEGEIKDFEASVDDLLLPFFHKIWEACGLDRK